MDNRLLAGALGLLTLAAAPAMPACDSFAGAFCIDAGTADRGLVITRTARIEFETRDDMLRLRIEDRQSDAHTILDLPFANQTLAGSSDDRSGSPPDR